MPKNWKTQLPATRKTVSTTMHASDAISATRARPLPDTPSVNATNDGTTANGLTIVTRVMKDSRTTLDSGMTAADYGTGTQRSLSTSTYQIAPAHGRPVIALTASQYLRTCRLSRSARRSSYAPLL